MASSVIEVPQEPQPHQLLHPRSTEQLPQCLQQLQLCPLQIPRKRRQLQLVTRRMPEILPIQQLLRLSKLSQNHPRKIWRRKSNPERRDLAVSSRMTPRSWRGRQSLAPEPPPEPEARRSE